MPAFFTIQLFVILIHRENLLASRGTSVFIVSAFRNFSLVFFIEYVQLPYSLYLMPPL